MMYRVVVRLERRSKNTLSDSLEIRELEVWDDRVDPNAVTKAGNLLDEIYTKYYKSDVTKTV